jgi:hypothetical protein
MEFLVSAGVRFFGGRGTPGAGSVVRMKRPWDAMAWWAIRRVPFNLLILVVGLISGFIVASAGSQVLKSGEDLGSPFVTVLFYALAANLCYTLGWISQPILPWGDTALTEKMRPKVFRLGVIFSASLTLLPAVVVLLMWAAHGLR